MPVTNISLRVQRKLCADTWDVDHCELTNIIVDVIKCSSLFFLIMQCLNFCLQKTEELIKV